MFMGRVDLFDMLLIVQIHIHKGLVVMLLSLASVGEMHQVKAIWVEDRTRDTLKEVGITEDCEILIVLKQFDDTIIVGIQEKRVAIGGELARKIIV